MAGGYLVLALVVSIIGKYLLPYNPYAQNFAGALQPPSSAHLFGTDDLGRDIFSRVVAGAPFDARIALIVVFASLALGGSLGAFAGYLGACRSRSN